MCVCVCVRARARVRATRAQNQLSSRFLCNDINSEMYGTIILHIAYVGVKLGLSH